MIKYFWYYAAWFFISVISVYIVYKHAKWKNEVNEFMKKRKGKDD